MTQKSEKNDTDHCDRLQWFKSSNKPCLDSGDKKHYSIISGDDKTIICVFCKKVIGKYIRRLE